MKFSIEELIYLSTISILFYRIQNCTILKQYLEINTLVHCTKIRFDFQQSIHYI